MKPEMSLKNRLALGFMMLLAVAALPALLAWMAGLLPDPGLLPFNPTHPSVILLSILALGVPAALLLAAWVANPLRRTTQVLDLAVKSFEDGEYGMRLTRPPQPELGDLVAFFNRMAEMHSIERSAIYQKELLLDTVIQAAPMGILLAGPTNRLIMANREARQMIHAGRPLLGLALKDLAAMAPEPLRNVLQTPNDALITLPGEEAGPQTWHVSQRHFNLNAQPHNLIMIKRLTRELRRREVETWKKLIRLINHELNNTLAPIRSLLHSGRTILENDGPTEKLGMIFETMTRTTEHLQRFLEDYAAFARLPHPRKERVDLAVFLEDLKSLIPFRIGTLEPGLTAHFDPGQMQRVLINLIKNGREASDEEVVLDAGRRAAGGLLIQVHDQGKGMSEEAMEKALLPFYSTKKKGTGLGLPLCREILEAHDGGIRLEAGAEGGLTVTCWLPAA